MTTRQYLTVKDIADLLKVGQPTVRHWIRDGTLRAIDVGREWRIAPDDLERFMQRHANVPHEGRGPSPGDAADPDPEAPSEPRGTGVSDRRNRRKH